MKRMLKFLIVAAALMAGPAAERSEAQAAVPVDTTRWVVTADGNEVRYRVREQLARIDFPSDAIGTTGAVTGAIAVADDGTIVRGASRIVIPVDSLVTDSERRDRYVRRRTLDTANFQDVVFVPTAAEGLPWPLPAAGEVSFRLHGDLTVRDVTRPVVWDVTATIGNGTLSGEARTSFTFDEFGIQKPSVGSVLSVDDEIRLEYGFRLRRESS